MLLPLSRRSERGRTDCQPAPVANDPKLTFGNWSLILLQSSIVRHPQAPLMRLFLIALGVVFAGLVAFREPLFNYVWMRTVPYDPYPAFMADYLSWKGSFSEFAVKAFPIGSDAKRAISQITAGGFKITKSSSDSVELRWRHNAIPCSEDYSIVVNQDADGTITKIDGRREIVCL
jgi:hypothetical protein